MNDFEFAVGDRVVLKRDPDVVGTIKAIDWNLIEADYGTTTVEVLWDDCDDVDIQWSNKLDHAKALTDCRNAP